MDYEFKRNIFDGTLHCVFSMGHEAVGRWLLDEIGTDKTALENLILHIENVIIKGGEWQQKGRFFGLWLNQDEVIIRANQLNEGVEMQLGEGLHNTYDQESIAFCGPEDLLTVLQAWRNFLNSFATRLDVDI